MTIIDPILSKKVKNMGLDGLFSVESLDTIRVSLLNEVAALFFSLSNWQDYSKMKN